MLLPETGGAAGGCWMSCVPPPVAQVSAAASCTSLPAACAGAAGNGESPAWQKALLLGPARNGQGKSTNKP